MKYRKFLIALLFSGILFAQENQVRDFSCLVIGELGNDRIETLKQIRNDKRSSKYINKLMLNDFIGPEESKKDKAKKDESESKDKENMPYKVAVNSYATTNQYLKAGGYIYVDKSTGENYVITTRQVTLYCEKFKISYKDAKTGELSVYEDLSPVYVNDELNIGILKMKNKVFSNGITISEKEVKDWEDVYITKCKAVTGVDIQKPDFTFLVGKTYVSECKVTDKTSDKLRKFKISNTETGNSLATGDGVFVPNNQSASGYSLIAFVSKTDDSYKDITAIYVTDIISFLNKAKKDDKEVISNKTNLFLSSIKSYNENSEYLISTKWLNTYTFDNYINFLDKETYTYKYKNKFDTMPFEAYRKAMYHQINDKYSKHLKNLELEKVDLTDATHAVATIKDTHENNIIKADWILEQNEWRLENVSLTPESKLYSIESDFEKELNKSKKTTSVFEYEPNSFFGVGVTIPFNYKVYDKEGTQIPDCNIVTGSHYFIESYWKWLGFGFSSDVIPGDEDTFRTINVDLCSRLPLNFSEVCVLPKLKGGFTWNVLSDAYAWGLYYEAGLEVIFGKNIGFGGTFKQQFINPLVDSTCKYNIMGTSIYLIINNF